MGMKLMVDLVSNHTAKDNPYMQECPDCFINGSEEDFKAHPDWFFEIGRGQETLYRLRARPQFPGLDGQRPAELFQPGHQRPHARRADAHSRHGRRRALRHGDADA